MMMVVMVVGPRITCTTITSIAVTRGRREGGRREFDGLRVE